MKYAIDLKAEEVTILGATGTRYDHTLANISLLALLRDEGIDAQIVDVHNEIEILRGPAEKNIRKNIIGKAAKQSKRKNIFLLLHFHQR